MADDRMPMRAPLSLLPLRLDDVVFDAGSRRIIHGLSATFDAGPRTVILGPNGAGKSVLLRLCHGLLLPTAGTMAWHSPELPGAPRRQAMVFQRPVLLRRTALGNVTYALKLAGIGNAQREERAWEALRKVGLEALADRSARVLSGGEQQRLALARVWALRPEILFLDEPTASLDPGATHEIESIIGAMHASGTKIVMVTHNLGQARRMADEILFLHQGRLVERAPTDRFLKHPASPEAASFLEGELPW
jgi:tungstate transport system ATP-binding protein